MTPTSDVKVRRALMMATDFNAINNSQYGGLGQILSWPTWRTPEYADIYLGLDDPECPADVKALYTYNPDGAKALLKDAGYPSGIKLTMTLSSDADPGRLLLDHQGPVVESRYHADPRPEEPVSMVPIWAGFSYKELCRLHLRAQLHLAGAGELQQRQQLGQHCPRERPEGQRRGQGGPGAGGH